MLGQRFLPTSYQAKLFQMDYDKHQRRLEQINKTSKSVSEDREEFFRSTFAESRNRHQKFQTSEKLISIDKTNQVLLDKLVKISRNQKPPLFKTAPTWPAHPGTLNTNFRKKQLEKIAQENEAMAKRLISQQGSVSRKKLNKDFEKHLEFSKNVQKINSPKIDKLLPVRSPKSQETTKGFKVKRKRIIKKSSASAQMEGTQIEPTEEAQSKEYIPTTQSNADVQQNESENPDKALQVDENNVTTISKDAETENREVEAEKEVKVDEQAQSDEKNEAEVEVKTEAKEENVEIQAEAQEEAEEKDVFNAQDTNALKSERTQENKSQVSANRTKRSGTVQPSANLEKSRLSTTRKGSNSNIDAKDSKAKSAVKETSQIQTNRSKTEVDKSQLEKSALKSGQRDSPTPSQKASQTQRLQQSQNQSPTPSQNQNQNLSLSQSQIQTQRKSPQPETESAKEQTAEPAPNQEDANEQVEQTNRDQAQVSVQRSTGEKGAQQEEKTVAEEKQEETIQSVNQQAVVSETAEKQEEPQNQVSAERGTS